MDLKVPTSFPVVFEAVQSPDYIDNERFLYCKIWICHTGKNLNNSYFTKEVLQKMIPSLAGIPIVGYISADEAGDVDFGGHEQKIVIDDNGIRLEYVGRAYGCVLENNNAKFETKLCSDGVEREFLTCEAVLWKKFDECINILERDGAKGQSMELYPGSIEGYFDVDGVFHFTDAKFEALCILGDKYIPAMTGSMIEYFNMNSIQQEIKEMLVELSNSIKQFTANFIAKDEIGTGDPIEIDNSKDSANMTGSWGDVDKTDLRNKILKARNYRALTREAYLIREKGWEEAPSEHLKYPHHEVKGGKLIVHKRGCQAALQYLNANDPDNRKAKRHLLRHYRELGLDTSNFDMSDLGGGNVMDEKLELLEEYGVSIEQLDFDIENMSLEELENKLIEIKGQQNDDKTVTDEGAVNFELTYQQLVDSLRRELASVQYVDELGFTRPRYYYIDNDDKKVYAEDVAEDYQLYSFEFTVEGDRVVINFDSKKRAKIVFVDVEESEDVKPVMMSIERAKDEMAQIKEELTKKFNNEKESAVSKVKSELNDVVKKYNALLEHTKELEKFKEDVERKQREEAEAALFAQYKQLEGIEEFETLKQRASEFTLQDLEKELALLYVKKVIAFTVNNQKINTNKIGLDDVKVDDDKPYGDLFERYVSKKYRRR